MGRNSESGIYLEAIVYGPEDVVLRRVFLPKFKICLMFCSVRAFYSALHSRNRSAAVKADDAKSESTDP